MSTQPCPKTRDFFAEGTPTQMEWVLTLYDQCLKIKAESKSKKPDNIITLDKWYQNELPKKIKSRGKDAHLTHDDLVQTIKWKLARGKFFPQLTNLVRINTPKAVQTESRKAFRKLPNLEQSMGTLTNLKGVGTTLASAILAAGAPHIAPFMADEVLLSLPEIDCLDYTMKEYMRMVEYVKTTVDRLNKMVGEGSDWTPHKVTQAVWTHYIAFDLKPELLEDMPSAKATSSSAAAPAATPAENGATPAAAEESTEEKKEVAEEMAPKEEEAAPSSGNGASEPPAAAEENGDSNMSSSTAEENSNPAPAPAAAQSEENGSSSTSSSTNGNAAHENGNGNENGKQEEEKPAANGVAENGKVKPAAAIPAESDENTNDSTKENKEEPSVTASAQPQKRPHEEDSNGSATVAEVKEPAAADDNATDEPAAKKLKEQQQESANTSAEAVTA